MQDKEKDKAGADRSPDPREAGEGNVLRVNDRRRFDPSGNPRNVEPMSPSKAGEPNPATAGSSSSSEPARQDDSNEALRRELEAARKRVDDLARAFQALNSDREEFKQRLSREQERMLEVEKGNIAQVLLEVVDELDLSLQAAGDDNSPLKQGVQLIRDGILGKLQALGIERVDPLGQRFDPNLVEAADVEITTDPANDQKVVGVMRAGYRMKDRVIRPARAKVARYVEPAHA
ncbi:MAG TPA: nucleotide exchange factor GrpE [Myxococcaceae bacterium]|nr:nucleotide exchange factor GrpE [Myxococcaceae bacterium]